jgi:hypothetical protein
LVLAKRVGGGKQESQRDLPGDDIFFGDLYHRIYFARPCFTGAVNYRSFDGVGDPLAFIFEPQI